MNNLWSINCVKFEALRKEDTIHLILWVLLVDPATIWLRFRWWIEPRRWVLLGFLFYFAELCAIFVCEGMF